MDVDGMTQVLTFTWSGAAYPDQDIRELPEADVPEYLDMTERDGREWGVAFAAYDAGALPWRLLRWYDDSTGQSGTTCEHVVNYSREAGRRC